MRTASSTGSNCLVWHPGARPASAIGSLRVSQWQVHFQLCQSSFSDTIQLLFDACFHIQCSTPSAFTSSESAINPFSAQTKRRCNQKVSRVESPPAEAAVAANEPALITTKSESRRVSARIMYRRQANDDARFCSRQTIHRRSCT